MVFYKRKAGAYTVDGVPGSGSKRRRITTMVVAPARVVSRRRRRNRRTGGYMGIEKKFYDTSLDGATILNALTSSEHNPSATISLNSVVQGDGESNRDGRQISMDTITIKGTILVPSQVNQTALDIASYVYIAIVLDKQTNGALLSGEDVFSNAGSVAVNVSNPFRNLQFIQRFQVLAWKVIRLHSPEAVWDGTNLELAGYMQQFTLSAKLKGLKTNYTNTTETIANIADNGLNVVCFTSGVGLAPTLSYKGRLRFYG